MTLRRGWFFFDVLWGITWRNLDTQEIFRPSCYLCSPFSNISPINQLFPVWLLRIGTFGTLGFKSWLCYWLCGWLWENCLFLNQFSHLSSGSYDTFLSLKSHLRLTEVMNIKCFHCTWYQISVQWKGNLVLLPGTNCYKSVDTFINS